MKKGHKHTPEAKQRMSIARKGRKFSGGWTLSEETRRRQGEAKKGIIPFVAIANAQKVNKGIKRSDAWKQRQSEQRSGSGSHFWKGGISKLPGYRASRERCRQDRIKNAQGTHDIVEWEELKKKFDYMCLCCKQQEPSISLTRDHIKPIIMGGSDYISNIQPLCRSCNSQKYTRHIDYMNNLTYLQTKN